MAGAVKKLMASPETKKAFSDLVSKAAGVYGSELNNNAGDTIEFLAAQVDVTAKLLAQGSKITPASLAIVLAQKGLSFTDLSHNDYVKCAGAMTSLGLSAHMTAAATATTGPGGLLPAILLVADMYMTVKDCSPVMKKPKMRLWPKSTNTTGVMRTLFVG